MNKEIYKQQLIEKIIEKRQELKYKKERLEENIFAGISTKAILVQRKALDLSVEKVLEIPTIRNWFKRQKDEYYLVSQKENIIDRKYTKGKAQIPILNKRIINKEIQNIKAKTPIKYVHLGGTEI